MLDAHYNPEIRNKLMSFLHLLYFKKTKSLFNRFWNDSVKTLHIMCEQFLIYFSNTYIRANHRPDSWAFYYFAGEDSGIMLFYLTFNVQLYALRVCFF